MSILATKETRVIVHGITGNMARQHTISMLEYGTNIVAGVRPGAGGTSVEGVPVFNNTRDAMNVTGADASIFFVPSSVMKPSVFEAMDAGIKLGVMVSEHVPLQDSMAIAAKAETAGTTLIGPNTPGIIVPDARCKIGFVPSRYFMPGPVGVASRSGTLTYEIVSRLTAAGIGQSTVVGVGGDPVIGTSFARLARMFEADPGTKLIMIIGEVGGSMEEDLAELRIKGEITKPIVAYIAGRTAPPGKRMGHAGAIISGGRGTIESKLEAFEKAGIPLASVPGEIIPLVTRVPDPT